VSIFEESSPENCRVCNEQSRVTKEGEKETMNLKEMFDKSREKWGLTSQLLMLAEESSELSVASLHMVRNIKNDTEEKRLKTLVDFANEITDVQFMIDEMIYYFKNETVGDVSFFNLIIATRKHKEKCLEKYLTVSPKERKNQVEGD